MSRQNVDILKTISPLIPGTGTPDDWAGVDEAGKAAIKKGMCDILTDAGCLSNGYKAAYDSVVSVVRQRIEAEGVVKRFTQETERLAVERGGRPNALPVDEINSVLAFSKATLTQAAIDEVMTNADKAAIEADEMGRNRQRIRDPLWDRQLTEFVNRAIPHQVQVGVTPAGLAVMGTSVVKIDSIIAEVDDNGEICCWMYEEPVVA